MPEERLQKILSAAGVASRRASEELIAQGRVTVDGEVAELGQKADPNAAEIRVDGERVNVHPDRTYVMLNKPQGVVTTMDDPQDRPTVAALVDVPQRLFPVGRLDMDTEGLLLLTNDGELTHKLTHPSYGVERHYLALVRGKVPRHVLAELQDGVELEDGPTNPTSVELVEESGGHSLVSVVLAEGRNREVRRMFDAVGLNLQRLARVKYGPIELGELRQGRWRYLTQLEIGALHQAVEPGDDPDPGDPRRSRREERERRGGAQGHGGAA
ncbi:MAG: pseudouridine synthase [Nitriliruptorales bacterium]|nr:pseudouridine synthase [Nitriliruptorales bacterium]